MVRRYIRLLVAFYVVTDALLAAWAFVLAYGIRFESGLIPITKGAPPVEEYLNVVPFVALLTPIAFHFQGVYRLPRGRSSVDDFFGVLIGITKSSMRSAASASPRLLPISGPRKLPQLPRLRNA